MPRAEWEENKIVVEVGHPPFVFPLPISIMEAREMRDTLTALVGTSTSAKPAEPDPSPAASTTTIAPVPKLRFLHVRDGYVAYDHITSVKVQSMGIQQPWQIIITADDGTAHYWSETHKDRAIADLACDRIVWAISL